jgi:uncharacterized protein (DUF2384 family)
MAVDSTRVPTNVWSELLVVYEPQAATGWLLGMNPLLGDRRPIDVLGACEETDVLRAVRAERMDLFA